MKRYLPLLLILVPILVWSYRNQEVVTGLWTGDCVTAGSCMDFTINHPRDYSKLECTTYNTSIGRVYCHKITP